MTFLYTNVTPIKTRIAKKLSVFLTSMPKEENVIAVYLLIMNGMERKPEK